MTYAFFPDAQAEYLEAVEFFECRRTGLGTALIGEFERTVDLAITHPNSWKLVHPSGVRRIDLKRFPYAVFYRVMTDGQIQITAFAHHRRRPGYWLKRMGL